MSAPKKLYVRHPENGRREITWCDDLSQTNFEVSGLEIGYVRGDIYDEVCADRDEAKRLWRGVAKERDEARRTIADLRKFQAVIIDALVAQILAKEERWNDYIMERDNLGI